LDLIVLATRNAGKAASWENFFAASATRIESLRDHPEVRLPPEHGTAYEENAGRAAPDALAEGPPPLRAWPATRPLAIAPTSGMGPLHLEGRAGAAGDRARFVEE